MTSPKKGTHHNAFFAEGALCRRLLGLASNFDPRTRAERGHHLPRHPRLPSRFSDILLSLQPPSRSLTMTVLVQRPVSCAVFGLRRTIRPTPIRKTEVIRRAQSTRSGAPSTPPPSAVPDSLDTGHRLRQNVTPKSAPPKVSTLDYTRLTSDNFLIFSDRFSVAPRVYRSSVSAGGAGTHAYLHASGMHNGRFPQNARGFLYYHLAPNAPALAGQVRFRVTGNNDPALFHSSEDLLRADHLPWKIPVIILPSRVGYRTLLSRLVDDGLISEHVLRAVSSLPSNVLTVSTNSTRTIHAFGQPFLLKFGRSDQSIYFIGADTVRQARISPIARSYAADTPNGPLMTGSALCCFEKSTRPEHAGRRVVVCRAIRILEPMKLTGLRAIPEHLMPREGELVRTNFSSGLDSPGWVIDVDRRPSQGPRAFGAGLAGGLDLLYDNEVRAGGPVGW